MNKDNLTNMTAAAFLTGPVTPATSNNVCPSARRRRSWLPTATVLLAVAAPAVYAEAGNPLNDTVNVSIGGFLLDTKTKIRVDGEVQSGDEFDASKDLGLDDSLPRALRHPRNVWSLHGYHECLTRLGRDEEAATIKVDLDAAQSLTDVPIVASCACRTVA